MEAITKLPPEVIETCNLCIFSDAIALVETRSDSFYVCQACLQAMRAVEKLFQIVDTRERLES